MHFGRFVSRCRLASFSLLERRNRGAQGFQSSLEPREPREPRESTDDRCTTDARQMQRPTTNRFCVAFLDVAL